MSSRYSSAAEQVTSIPPVPKKAIFCLSINDFFEFIMPSSSHSHLRTQPTTPIPQSSRNISPLDLNASASASIPNITPPPRAKPKPMVQKPLPPIPSQPLQPAPRRLTNRVNLRELSMAIKNDEFFFQENIERPSLEQELHLAVGENTFEPRGAPSAARLSISRPPSIIWPSIINKPPEPTRPPQRERTWVDDVEYLGNGQELRTPEPAHVRTVEPAPVMGHFSGWDEEGNRLTGRENMRWAEQEYELEKERSAMKLRVRKWAEDCRGTECPGFVPWEVDSGSSGGYGSRSGNPSGSATSRSRNERFEGVDGRGARVAAREVSSSESRSGGIDDPNGPMERRIPRRRGKMEW